MESKPESIKNIDGYLKWVRKLGGTKFIYRGLADHEWEIVASASRRPGAPDLAEYNNKILNDAKMQGYDHSDGQKLADLEIFARMQHQEGATCLIDFTLSPLIALWFACREQEKKDGLVVAIDSQDSTTLREVKYDDIKTKELKYFYEHEELWKWQPSHVSKRITAQYSIFVFGRKKIPTDLKAQINSENKIEILKVLSEQFGIDEESLYPDFDGFSRINSHKKQYSSIDPDREFSAIGVNNHQLENFETHIPYYSEANDKDANVYFNLAFAQNELGRKNEAIKDYDKAIELNPNYANAYHNRGVVKNGLGQPQDAITDYDRAIELNPKLAIAYINRGNAKNELRQPQDAITDYNEAINLNPNYSEAYHNRGFVKNGLGQPQDAITDYDRAIELNPKLAIAYINRGNAKNELGRPEDAITDYDKAIDLNPNYSEAYYCRGAAKNSLGQHKEAIRDYEEAININPNYAEAYNNRGNVTSLLGQHKEAIRDYEEAIKINPLSDSAYNNLGIAKYKLGHHKDAIKYYNKAIELNPKDAQTYYNRSVVKANSGDHLGSKFDYVKAAKLDPERFPLNNS